MTKTILYYFLIMSPLILQGQDLIENLKSELCDCIKLTFKNIESIDQKDAMVECVENKWSKYETELIDYSTKDIDLSLIDNPYEYGFKKGYKLSESIFFDNQDYFMSNCEGYFSTMNNVRNKSLEVLQEDVSINKINDLTTKINNLTLKNNFLWERGACYLALRDYKKAIEDFDQCLKNDPDHTGALYFKAWTLEQTKNYKPAIELYSKVYKVHQDPMIRIAMEITKYKLKLETKK